MITIDKLKEVGENTDEGLARCCGMEALYLRLVAMIPAEANFDKLARALEDKNYDEAFEAAHALKGVLGNLSLTPMYETCSEITERLRARTDTDCAALLTELLSQRDTLSALCAD